MVRENGAARRAYASSINYFGSLDHRRTDPVLEAPTLGGVLHGAIQRGRVESRTSWQKWGLGEYFGTPDHTTMMLNYI